MNKPMDSFERELDAELDRGFGRYRRSLIREGLSGLFHLRRRYAQVLANLAYHGDSVEEVIRSAAEASADRPALQSDFYAHGEEERGHGRIAWKDLEALDVPESIKDTLRPTWAQLALSAYTQQIAGREPIAILGFLAAAEGLTYHFADRAVRGLKWCGVSEKSMNFLILHARVDRDHFPQLRTMALKHAQSKDDRRSVLEAVRVTGELLALGQRA